ncbi:uncharacterized protein [Dysidea avara]|uniref:uncharacterized protein n=1 Tax=Dysidea avara TaxID=196820 RepID=UPI00332A1ABD
MAVTNPNSEFKVFRFKVVLFGATSSPFALHAVLFHHLQQSHTLTAANMLRNLYVDNVITECITQQQATQFYCKSRSIMSEARLNLQAWASNCTQLNTLAQQENVADSTILVNVLDLQWDTVTDKLHFIPKMILPQKHTTVVVTKRYVLQQSSRVFDPIGYLAPVTIQVKLFLKKLWQHKINRDDPLENSLKDEWLTIAHEIEDATTVFMLRQYSAINSSDTSLQLHVFADANLKAYETVAYLTAGDNVNFITAKSWTAPVKILTLPRLELMAVVLATRVSKFIANSLSLQAIPLHP